MHWLYAFALLKGCTTHFRRHVALQILKLKTLGFTTVSNFPLGPWHFCLLKVALTVLKKYETDQIHGIDIVEE